MKIRNLCLHERFSVCVCVCVRACMCACMHVCMHMCKSWGPTSAVIHAVGTIFKPRKKVIQQITGYHSLPPPPPIEPQIYTSTQGFMQDKISFGGHMDVNC